MILKTKQKNMDETLQNQQRVSLPEAREFGVHQCFGGTQQ